MQHNAYSQQVALSLQATLVQNMSAFPTVSGSSTVLHHQPDGQPQLVNTSSSTAAPDNQAFPPVSTGQWFPGLTSGAVTNGTHLMTQPSATDGLTSCISYISY